MDRTLASDRKREDFSYEDVSTLHLIPEEVSHVLAKHNLVPRIHHISTALATYAHRTQSRFIVFLSERVMHICVMDKHGDFLMYNQYKSYYDRDFLYFISLVYSKFFPEDDIPIHLCGDIPKSGQVWKFIRRYFSNIKFIDGAIKMSEGKPEVAPAFYDLHLCRQCV